MKIKGAIFDMDGTLVDSLMFWENLWERIGRKYMNDASFRPEEELDKKLRTMVFSDAMRYFKDYYKLDADTDEFLHFTVDGTTEFYRSVAKPKKGARELLESLREKNIKIVLASATVMKEIQFALQHYDLKKYFESILSCDDIGVGKDKPDIYLIAKEQLGLDASEICVFEDSFVALETARRAGFQTVGIYDQYNFDQERLKRASDIYLQKSQTLDELIDMIEA